MISYPGVSPNIILPFWCFLMARSDQRRVHSSSTEHSGSGGSAPGSAVTPRSALAARQRTSDRWIRWAGWENSWEKGILTCFNHVFTSLPWNVFQGVLDRWILQFSGSLFNCVWFRRMDMDEVKQEIWFCPKVGYLKFYSSSMYISVFRRLSMFISSCSPFLAPAAAWDFSSAQGGRCVCCSGRKTWDVVPQ